MDITVEHVDSVVVVTLPEIRVHSYDPMERHVAEFQKIIDDNVSRNIVVDMSNVTFIATVFLSGLVRAHMSVIRRNGSFAVAGLTDNVFDAIRRANLDRLLDIFPTREDAIQSISGG